MRKEISYKEFGVTLSLFLEWRTPKFGQSNPSRMNNKVWEWLIRSRKSAYQATQDLNGPSSFDEGPTWCFDRFGQTSTKLPDGRIVYIGGEHEDYYDPDFYIYNDVVVINPDQSIEIYGYPLHIFPPTDFHSSTLINNKIVIIGSLGYPEKRILGETQVYLLNIENFEISKVNTTGAPPGWIHDHQATLSSDGKFITLEKGKIDLGDKHTLRENIDKWKLNLSHWRWERLTERKWKRWEVKRCDRQPNHLWDIRQALWCREFHWANDYKKSVKKLAKELGIEPNIDLINNLYSPEIPHQQIPDKDDEYGVYRISIDGIIVRYVEELFAVQVTVEGHLPEKLIEIIKSDMLKKISILENTECDLEVI
ncbi:MAG: hypothetical protein AB4426_11790 [Xenococcaceae cyanobacterium]